jgi:ATP adenylyltransferase
MSDAWDRLYTPHRLQYLRGETGAENVCPFCISPATQEIDVQAGDSTELDLVCMRGVHAYVVLNLYPYNSGHLLVCPYRHVANYTDLTTVEVAEIASLTQEAMRTLRVVSKAQGFNIGMNQGSISGAGIADHLHQHVVPRWGGDTNFMPIVGGTKVLPQLLSDTRTLLEENWQRS